MPDKKIIENMRQDDEYQQFRSCVDLVIEQITEDDEKPVPSVAELVDYLTQEHVDMSPAHFALMCSEMINSVVSQCIEENPGKASLVQSVIVGGGISKNLVALLQVTFLAGMNYTRRNTLAPVLLSSGLTRSGEGLRKLQQEGKNVER